MKGEGQHRRGRPTAPTALTNSSAVINPGDGSSSVKAGLNPDALLREPQVLEILPIAHSTLWKGVKEGRYPPPLKLGPRTSCWRASDILALIERAATGEDRHGS